MFYETIKKRVCGRRAAGNFQDAETCSEYNVYSTRSPFGHYSDIFIANVGFCWSIHYTTVRVYVVQRVRSTLGTTTSLSLWLPRNYVFRKYFAALKIQHIFRHRHRSPRSSDGRFDVGFFFPRGFHSSSSHLKTFHRNPLRWRRNSKCWKFLIMKNGPR